jgi:hypothetical protein
MTINKFSIYKSQYASTNENSLVLTHLLLVLRKGCISKIPSYFTTSGEWADKMVPSRQY